ncbi:MAG: copper chaperone PCu(A)C [Acidobacteriota bacterium]|nr:copper chaperone PCu(A)C [Acidobacteriota bacterium]
MTHRLLIVISTVWIFLGLSGCAPEGPPQEAPETAVEAAGPRLSVEGVHAQLMGEMGAVYFRVVNQGSASDRLVRVETPAAESAETHESLVEDGVVRMRARPDGFEIPAGGSLSLEPGGKHVMLMGLDTAAMATGRLPLTVIFEHTPPVEVEIEVDAAGEGGAGHEHG